MGGADRHGNVRVTPEREGRVDVVLDRPEKLDALNRDTLDQLATAFTGLSDSARVVVLWSSSPRSFCVGADLHEHRNQDPASAFSTSQRGNRTLAAVPAAPVPVVAQIEGWCLGGLELALARDLRIASADAVLGFPEVSLGHTPACAGCSQRRLLPRTPAGRVRTGRAQRERRPA